MRHFAAAIGLSLTLALSGCGAGKAVGSKLATATTLADGRAASQFGFGAEGGAQPAVLKRAAGGYALVYVGTGLGDRHLYTATSGDGKTWTKPQQVLAGEFSDQAPALVEDADGHLHLFFASNRDGEGYAAYQATESGGGFQEAQPVAGFAGAQDLAVAYADGNFTLVADVLGSGLLAASSADGVTFAAPSELSYAGTEPAAVSLPDGRTLVAFQREGKILAVAGKPGSWGDEAVAATAANGSRLRDPALAWSGNQGDLVYSEKVSDGTALTSRTIKLGENSFSFAPGSAPRLGAGEARGAAIGFDHNGSKLLAWGMKTANGQQGIVVSTR